MPRRYRFIIAGAVTAVLVVIGGIAVAESGGQSADHRKNPTTTTGEPAPTQPTVTQAPKVPGPEDGVENDGSGDSNRQWALCHALHQGSSRGQEMKALHGQAFQGLECNDVQPVAGDQGEGGGPQGAPPDNSHAGGNGGGQSPGNAGGVNPHAAAAPGRNK